MRTNIVLNDELIAEAQKYSRARTKTALVEEALRAFVRSRAMERQRASYESGVLALRERLDRVRPRESAHEMIRRDRDRR